jgi:hypothetical protein
VGPSPEVQFVFGIGFWLALLLPLTCVALWGVSQAPFWNSAPRNRFRPVVCVLVLAAALLITYLVIPVR